MNNKRIFHDAIVILDKKTNTKLRKLTHFDYTQLIDIVNVKGGYELTIKHNDDTYTKEFTHQVIFVTDMEMRTTHVSVNDKLERIAFYGIHNNVNIFGQPDAVKTLVDKHKLYRRGQKTVEDVFNIKEDVVFITLSKAERLGE